MTTACEKIQAAAAATDKIHPLVECANEHLERFQWRVFNGAGVYADPSSLARQLREAQAAINDALRHFNATAWPSNEDYDRAEEESAEERRARWGNP
jgi:hypothetical protein